MNTINEELNLDESLMNNFMKKLLRLKILF